MRPFPVRPPSDRTQDWIDRGVPLGPVVGHGYEASELPPRGEPLHLLTGTLDDVRVAAVPGSPLYGMAAYAYAHRDRWSSEETRDYWRAHLFAWPAREARASFAETMIYLAAVGLNCGLTKDEVYQAFWPLDEKKPLRAKQTLRNGKVMARALRHRAELLLPETGPYVPRVVTASEQTARNALLEGKADTTEGTLWLHQQTIGDEDRTRDVIGAPVHFKADVLVRKVTRAQREILSSREALGGR